MTHTAEQLDRVASAAIHVAAVTVACSHFRVPVIRVYVTAKGDSECQHRHIQNPHHELTIHLAGLIAEAVANEQTLNLANLEGMDAKNVRRALNRIGDMPGVAMVNARSQATQIVNHQWQRIQSLANRLTGLEKLTANDLTQF